MHLCPGKSILGQTPIAFHLKCSKQLKFAASDLWGVDIQSSASASVFVNNHFLINSQFITICPKDPQPVPMKVKLLYLSENVASMLNQIISVSVRKITSFYKVKCTLTSAIIFVFFLQNYPNIYINVFDVHFFSSSQNRRKKNIFWFT